MNEALDLSQFYGTQSYHRFNPILRQWLCTDGALYVAQQCQAFWLLDHIAIHHSNDLKEDGDMIVAKLQVLDRGAKIIVEGAGNDKIIKSHNIDFTDFPKQGVVLWGMKTYHAEGSINILMLPSEY